MTSAEPLEQPTPDPPAVEDGCPVCPHPWSAHDTIAARFCRVTERTGNPRACSCATIATYRDELTGLIR
ncbi:hypothetical protein EV191_103141 [Tamaricihabitans halophyticus]|uniref:Uncharacterized protein n=1 Tax=Tamaricihabitans halophyticus TaxID=1262583 RepID=A0A4R2QVK9_9PSEU|nr:RGCVC family protein [Tamaricihabitans halophyticus]TCP54100.1 hypothetical protein EV191_103141 [Tamaricihabitans halophyticus]